VAALVIEAQERVWRAGEIVVDTMTRVARAYDRVAESREKLGNASGDGNAHREVAHRARRMAEIERVAGDRLRQMWRPSEPTGPCPPPWDLS
jgi:hypothetical protein